MTWTVCHCANCTKGRFGLPCMGPTDPPREDLDRWLTQESHYIRLRAAVTGDTLKETIERAALALYGDALLRFNSVDLLGMLARRVHADRDLGDLSYTMIREMRAAIRMSQETATLAEVKPEPSEPAKWIGFELERSA